jgi:hypothetical protein
METTQRVTHVHGNALPKWWVGSLVESEGVVRYYLRRRNSNGKVVRRSVAKESVSVA